MPPTATRPSPFSTTNTSIATTSTTSLFPPTAESSAPAAELDDFVFSETSDGVATLTTCNQQPVDVPPADNAACQVHVDTSRDGGATWQTGQVVANIAGYDTGQLSASSTTIYLMLTFQPGTPNSLLVSHDEGHTWTRSPLSDPAEVVPGAVSDLALSGTCLAGESSCTDSLWASTNGGRSWHALPRLPVTGEAELARGGDTTFLLAGSAAGSTNELGTPDELLSSNNGGATWASHTAPCYMVVTPPLLVALDAQHLWMACGHEPGVGNEVKAIWRSADGGRSWQPEASITMESSSPAGQLGTGGYVASFAATSEQAAFLGLDRGTLYKTVDGGLTWTEVLGGFPPPGAFVDQIEFIGNEDGWADNTVRGQPLGGVYRTTDGGRSWTQSVPR